MTALQGWKFVRRSAWPRHEPHSFRNGTTELVCLSAFRTQYSPKLSAVWNTQPQLLCTHCIASLCAAPSYVYAASTQPKLLCTNSNDCIHTSKCFPAMQEIIKQARTIKSNKKQLKASRSNQKQAKAIKIKTKASKRKHKQAKASESKQKQAKASKRNQKQQKASKSK